MTSSPAADDGPPRANRRAFLSGEAARQQAAHWGDQLADRMLGDAGASVSGRRRIALSTRAMACEFQLQVNGDEPADLAAASNALDQIAELEAALTVYRPDSDVQRVNQRAADESCPVSAVVMDVFRQALEIAVQTDGAYNPVAGRLIQLWRTARQQQAIPNEADIDSAVAAARWRSVQLDPAASTVRFDSPGPAWDLGSIGKGFALDRVAAELTTNGITSFCLQGGHSSILVQGDHIPGRGWPIGLRDPLRPQQLMATLWLTQGGFSCSGGTVQSFRHAGQRLGHIIDPRTGWPAAGFSTVIVLAPTAAQADALSTAFYVLGPENADRYWNQLIQADTNIGALLVPQTQAGQSLPPRLLGIDPDRITFAR